MRLGRPRFHRLLGRAQTWSRACRAWWTDSGPLGKMVRSGPHGKAQDWEAGPRSNHRLLERNPEKCYSTVGNGGPDNCAERWSRNRWVSQARQFAAERCWWADRRMPPLSIEPLEDACCAKFTLASRPRARDSGIRRKIQNRYDEWPSMKDPTALPTRERWGNTTERSALDRTKYTNWSRQSNWPISVS